MILTSTYPLQQMMSSLIIIAVLCILCVVLSILIKRVDPKKKTPLWLIPIIFVVDWINGMAKDNLGKKWKIYAPILLTLTIFLFFSNISGVFGLVSPTSYLMIDVVLAIAAFLIIQITGITSQGPLNYLKGFLDPIPLLLPINIIGEITLPVSLSLRLMGNIMSGTVISKLVTGLGNNFLGGWWHVIVLPFINVMFDLFSGVIQVLVFVLLTTIFAGNKLSDKDKLEDVTQSSVA